MYNAPSSVYADALVGAGGDTDGGAGSSMWPYENLDVPAIVNEMAAQTLLNHQDRCTKNSFMFRDPVTTLWSRIPWDMEDVFPSDFRSGWDTCDRCVMMDLGMEVIENKHST